MVNAFNVANKHEFDMKVWRAQVQGAGEVCDMMGDMLDIVLAADPTQGGKYLGKIVGGVFNLGKWLAGRKMPEAQAAVKGAGQQVQQIKNQINALIQEAERLYYKQWQLLQKLREARHDVKIEKEKRSQQTITTHTGERQSPGKIR